MSLDSTDYDIKLSQSTFNIEALLLLYLKSISKDPMFSHVLPKSTVREAIVILKNDGIYDPVLTELLMPLYSALQVHVDDPIHSGSPSVDVDQLKLALLARLRIINKLH
jgi:hypothetical protein